MTTQRITDDLCRLLKLLPPEVQLALNNHPDSQHLLEVVMDLGRVPEARYPNVSKALGNVPISREDLQLTLERIGNFQGYGIQELLDWGRDMKTGTPGCVCLIVW